MSGFLLDTNVISELVKPKPDSRVTSWIQSVEESVLHLSVLTLGEIRQGIAALPNARKRATLEAWLETDLRHRFHGRILPIDDGVADRWGLLTAHARMIGVALPVIDALLAATALHHNLTFVTRDVSAVRNAGVSFFNPWEAD